VIRCNPATVILKLISNKATTETRNCLFYLRPKDKFDKKDVIRILTELNFPYSKPEVDQWIWEVDEDLDGAVN
jgi:hypothetical protein